MASELHKKGSWAWALVQLRRGYPVMRASLDGRGCWRSPDQGDGGPWYLAEIEATDWTVPTFGAAVENGREYRRRCGLAD